MKPTDKPNVLAALAALLLFIVMLALIVLSVTVVAAWVHNLWFMLTT